MTIPGILEVFAISIIFAVCRGCDDNPFFSGEDTEDGTHVSGKLDDDTRWSGDEGPYYIDGDILVPAGVTLTIERGTTVIFGNAGASDYGKNDRVELIVKGNLVAEGDSASGGLITFTSGEEQPEPGEYYGIRFDSTCAAGHMTHCLIEYGMYGIEIENHAADYQDSTILLESITIEGCARTAIKCFHSSPVISGDTLRNNEGVGILCQAAAPLITENVITDNSSRGIECLFDSNALILNNYIARNFGEAIYCDGSVPDIIGNQLVGDSTVLTTGIVCRNGFTAQTIQANSISNHTIGIENYSTFLHILGDTIRHGGIGISSQNTDSIHVISCLLDSCEIGIYCENSGMIIRKNTIRSSYGEGVKIVGAQPEIHLNNIEGNATYGILVEDSSTPVPAEENWWNDPSGPSHPGNPGGTGDRASDLVDFVPWLESPFSE